MDHGESTLNHDCNYHLYMAKKLIADTKNASDREKAIRWVRFLMNSNKTIQEMQLRNDFLYYLVINLQEGRLRPPFDCVPPYDSELADMAGLIPSRKDEDSFEDFMQDLKDPIDERPIIMSKSPDGGEFFSQQPVPCSGSFCYLTLTNTKKEE